MTTVIAGRECNEGPRNLEVYWYAIPGSRLRAPRNDNR
jgi:hypothetical protein